MLGTKFVRLMTGDEWEHPLEDGDTITDTTTPVELLDLQNTGTRLFDESDGEALNDLMASLSEITDGKRVQVQQILDGLTDLTQVVSDRETEARRLLDSAQTLTGTLADRDEELGAAIDNLNVVVGDLAERRTALVELLDSTSAAARELSDVVGDNREDLDVVLDEVHTTLETIGDHQVDLAQAIAYLGVGIEGFASIGYNGPEEIPRPWGNIFTQLIGPIGPDGVLGACMPIDRMLDLVFGPDPLPCEERTGPIMASPSPGDDGPPVQGEPPDLTQPAGDVERPARALPDRGAVVSRVGARHGRAAGGGRAARPARLFGPGRRGHATRSTPSSPGPSGCIPGSPVRQLGIEVGQITDVREHRRHGPRQHAHRGRRRAARRRLRRHRPGHRPRRALHPARARLRRAARRWRTATSSLPSGRRCRSRWTSCSGASRTTSAPSTPRTPATS